MTHLRREATTETLGGLRWARAPLVRALALLAVAIVLPACHNDDDDDNGGFTPPPTSPPPTNPNPPPPSTPTAPDAPATLVATAGDASVTLEWSGVAGAESFSLKRATVSGGPYTPILEGIIGLTATDTTVTNGTQYFYVATAVNGAGESPHSPEANATPISSAPGLPGAWTKFPGPVFTVSADPAAWDNGHVESPAVLKAGDQWVLYYSATSASDVNTTSVGRATSPDGVTWTRTGTVPVLAPSGTGFDASRVVVGTVLFDSGQFRMWYEGNNGIGYAESIDGISWTRESTPVLSPGPSGTFDASAVREPHVIRDGILLHMWYAAHAEFPPGAVDPSPNVGYATSLDGRNWVKHSEPVLTVADGGFTDAIIIDEPVVMKVGDTFWMAYARQHRGTQPSAIVAATSSDGIHWTPAPSMEVPAEISAGAPGSFDSELHRPFVLQDADRFLMWYEGSFTGGIGLAQSGGATTTLVTQPGGTPR